MSYLAYVMLLSVKGYVAAVEFLSVTVRHFAAFLWPLTLTQGHALTDGLAAATRG